MSSAIFFTKEFWPTVGGIGEHSHQMARHLTELGENVTLLHYVPYGYQGDAEFDRKCGYPVVRFSTKVGTGAWYRDPWARRELAAILVKEARRIGADYIVFNGFDGSPVFIASLLLAVRILGIPSFLFVHSSHGFPEPRSRLHRFATKTLLRSAAGVMTVSHWVTPFLDGFRINPERLHVIHNGVDLQKADFFQSMRNPERFARLDAALPSGEPNILCVARLHPNKRIDRLIRGMPRILARIPNARLAIAGIGGEEERLRELIADSPARHSITLLGLVTGDEKLECYARCAVFALPSDYESFGLVILEAHAFAKPVVATGVGGVREAVEHGVSGVVVEPGDEHALSDAIIRLLNDPEEARRVGENGRRRVESEFTWKHSAQKLLAVVLQARDEC